MPTYDYQCEACGHTFEEFQSITAKPLKKCPACGKSKLQRLIGTGAGIIFKGSGFYETDYRSESYKQAAKADQEKSSSSSSSSSSSDKPAGDSGSSATRSDSAPKADAKPATASSAKPAKKASKPAK